VTFAFLAGATVTVAVAAVSEVDTHVAFAFLARTTIVVAGAAVVENNTHAAFALLAVGTIVVGLAAIFLGRAGVSDALEAAAAAVFGVRAAATGPSVVAGIGRWAVLGVRNAGTAHTRCAGLGAVVIARAAGIQVDTHVTFAFLASAAIARVNTLDAVGVGGIARDVANRGAGRAVAIVATFRAGAALRRAAQFACRAAAVQLTGAFDTEPFRTAIRLCAAVCRCYALWHDLIDADAIAANIGTAEAVCLAAHPCECSIRSIFPSAAKRVAASYIRAFLLDVDAVLSYLADSLRACELARRAGYGKRACAAEQAS